MWLGEMGQREDGGSEMQFCKMMNKVINRSDVISVSFADLFV